MSRQGGLEVRRMLQGAASPTVVIRGLDPPAGPKPFGAAKARVSIFKKTTPATMMDGRVKPGHEETCNEGIVILAQRLRRCRGRCALLRASKDGRLHSPKTASASG